MVICKIYHNNTLTFSSENIILNSFSLNRFSSSAVAPEFGNVSAGELLFTIDTSTTQNTVERGDLLTVEFDDTYSIGEFIVTKVAKRQGAFDVTCLDRMIELDGKANLSGVTFPLTASAFINQVYGTGLGMTVDISANIHNPTIDDPIFEEGVTYRQVLSKVCECMGANAWYTDRLNIGWYEDSNISYTSAEYFSADLSEKGFDVAVEVTDDVTATPVEINDNGITLRIVANPFLANKTSAERTAIASAIKQNIGTVSWYGGDAVVIPELPYLLPNSIVEIDGKAFPVTSVTHGINENIKLESKIQSDDNAYNYSPDRYLEQKINSISVGGRNMLIDTNAPSLTKVYAANNRYFSNSTVTAVVPTFIELINPPINAQNGVRFVVGEVANTSRHLTWYSGGSVHLEDGETYTLSAYFKITSGTKAQIRWGVGPTTSVVATIKDITNTDWKRYSHTFTFDSAQYGDTNDVRIYIGIGANYIATVETCGYQLERGTKATDWQVAPEETEAMIEEPQKHFFYRDDSGVHITMVENDYTTGRNVLMDSNGLDIRNGTTSLANFGATARVGQSSANHVAIDSNGVKVNNGSTNLATFGTTTRVGQSSGKNVAIDSDNVDIKNGSTVLARFGATTTIGQSTSKNVAIDSNSVDIKNGSTVLASLGSTITLGQTSGKNVYIDSNSLSVRNGTTKLADFGSTITLGQTNKKNIVINPDVGIDFKNGSQPLGSINVINNQGALNMPYVYSDSVFVDEAIYVGSSGDYTISAHPNGVWINPDVIALDSNNNAHKLTNKVDKFTVVGSWGGEVNDRSVPTGNTTPVYVGNFKLQEGIYLVIIYADWDSNATGRRYINLGTTSGATSGVTRWFVDSRSATPNGITTNRIVGTINVTTETMYYINVLQNSGSDLNVRTRYVAIKLG